MVVTVGWRYGTMICCTDESIGAASIVDHLISVSRTSDGPASYGDKMSSLGASENPGFRNGAFSEPGSWHRSVHYLPLLEFSARGGSHERRIFIGCIPPAPF